MLFALPRPITHKGIDAYRAKLQHLNGMGVNVWLTLDSATNQTRFWLNFAEYTFHQTESGEAIYNQLCRWFSPSQVFERIYLLAEPNTEAPCYDITEYIRRCLDGDLAIADRLKGRTIFHLYQREIQAEDLLSRNGVDEFAHRSLRRYFHELADLIGHPIVGFCCTFPTFLSPLRAPSLSIPWSAELIDEFQTDSEAELLSHLPLLCYETYDSATVRSLFWERLTQQFAKVCVGGLREFCHQWNLQFAVNFPATAKTLEVDIRAILRPADRPILNADLVNQGKQFLIAKLTTSKLRPESSGPISICRSASSADLEERQPFASDSVLGFNSWMISASHLAQPDRLRGTLGQHQLERFFSIGVPKRSVLVASPVHSLWTKPDPKTWNWVAKEWSWLCQTIWELGYDFDIVSETDLVTAGIDKGARGLRLNGASYPLFLLPSCLSLQEATVDLLNRFVKARGKLIAIDPVPYLLNGRIGIDPYPLERLLYRWRTSILRGTTGEKAAGLERLLRKWIRQPVQVYAKPDNVPTLAIAIQHRQSGDLDLFYLFNRGKCAMETLIEIRWEATIEEWNTTTGKHLAQDHWQADGNTYTILSFEPKQGRLVVSRRNGHRGID